MSDVEASLLALRDPSPVRAAKAHSHPAKPLVAGCPCVCGLLLHPGPASPSWADPKHPPHSPRGPTVPSQGAQRKGTSLPAFCCPQSAAA